jgi:hypothetical protein
MSSSVVLYPIGDASMNRKYLWLTAITLPGVLMSGCWAGLHQFAIHTFEVTDFVAALRVLGLF